MILPKFCMNCVEEIVLFLHNVKQAMLKQAAMKLWLLKYSSPMAVKVEISWTLHLWN